MNGIFKGELDNFNNINVIDFEQYSTIDINKFIEIIKNSINYWIDNKYSSISIKIIESLSKFIPILIENGFSFHYCQTGEYIILKKNIINYGVIDLNFANHYISCGGVVINKNNEILLITEHIAPGRWKIPGGSNDSAIHPEDIFKTAIREVWEETGIKTEFDCILGFRQIHNHHFNRSDIYFICALKPIDINPQIEIDKNEISECKWTPVKEFIEIKNCSTFQKIVARLSFEYCFNNYKGMKSFNLLESDFNKGFIYHNDHDE